MNKTVRDLHVAAAELLRDDYVLLRLIDPTSTPMPPVAPGQFVEVLVSQSATTFLRRPISVNDFLADRSELHLLVHAVGDGTRALLNLKAGDSLNCIFPLGHGFTMPEADAAPSHYLLVGGGVGTAPLLYYGRCLKERGHQVTFLLGGRSRRDILQTESFEALGRVCVTTEDATMGEKGFVTNHSVLKQEHFDAVAACAPKPMMQAVARYAAAVGTPCEVSLENLMACGLGACLCCVEKDVHGHNLCVCKEGPVFNIEQLQWLISK